MKFPVVLLAFISLGSSLALGAEPKMVKEISVDLDGDGVADKVAELTEGTEKNILRIRLSRYGKTYLYKNLLENTELYNKGRGYCGSWDQSLAAMKKAGTFVVDITKGQVGGCESSYSSEGMSMEVGVKDGRFQILKYVDTARSFAVGDLPSNGHEYTYDFRAGVVSGRSWDYKVDNETKRRLPTGCVASLSDYDRSGGLPSCARGY